MEFIINYFNQNSGAIQAISTVVLVLVTIWYAVSTKRMANLIRDQVTSKRLIEKTSIGCQFIEKCFSETIIHKNNFLTIKALFDVRNEGNASGSIYKPDLLISLPKGSLVFRVGPKTKSYKTLYSRALEYQKKKTINVDTWIDFKKEIEAGNFVMAHWSENASIEKEIKEETGATIRCIPFKSEFEKGACVKSGNPSERRVLFAKSY